MRKFIRSEEPDVLKEHGAKWTRQWVALRQSNPSGKFQWYETGLTPANERILPALKEQTQSHCSFCDAFPVGGVSLDTVEHFKPKGKFPEHAYTWENLYYCCNACQKAKGDQWDPQLLHADHADYVFSRYFEFDFTTGQIRPNSLASPDDQMRALVTIRLYGLDSKARRTNRLNVAMMRSRSKEAEPDVTLCAYRDFLGL